MADVQCHVSFSDSASPRLVTGSPEEVQLPSVTIQRYHDTAEIFPCLTGCVGEGVPRTTLIWDLRPSPKQMPFCNETVFLVAKQLPKVVAACRSEK